MNPANLYSAKNLFLVFPAGCGGNHLANMISMSPVFSQRFTGLAYKNRMLLKYVSKFKPKLTMDDKVAHFGYLENLQKKNILENEKIIKNNSGVNIWCTHYHEYFNPDNALNEYSNRVYGVMSYPSEFTIAHTRMSGGMWHIGAPESSDAAYDYSIAGLTSPKCYPQTNIPSENIFVIDTDIFFSAAGYDHLKNICSVELGITLPVQCERMHQLWLDTIVRVYGG